MTVYLRQVAFSCFFLLFATMAAQAAPTINGMALHSQLGKEQFIAAVYAGTPTTVARDLLTADEDKVMEIRVLTDNLYARRFQRMWIEGIAINAGAAEMEKHAQHLADFSNMLRLKLTTGDILRLERHTGQNLTRLLVDGKLLGTIPDARFFDLLLRTWVGPVPLSSSFKEGLLAGGKVDAELARRFDGAQPTAERIAEVAAALQTPRPTKEPAAPGGVAARSDADDPASAAVAAKPPTAVASPKDDSPTVATASKPPSEELLTAESLFKDEEIFAEEEKEAYAFTAENLLSEQIYIAKLTKWTGNFVKYPRAALRSGQQGTVRITVTVQRDGRIKDVQLLEKSEHESLNKAATRAVKSASPYPAVPEEIPGEQFLFTVPVVFKLD